MDQFWSAADADPNMKNNINNNKGNCEYLLYALIDEQKIDMAKFYMNLSATSANDAFKIDYCNPAFNADGTANNNSGYYFKLMENQDKNILSLITNKGSTTAFYLQAIVNAQTTIRPGDDMLFRFTLANYEQHITTPATAGDGRFVATYDAKLLWRANLYINERTNAADRAHDWNDLNPWNVPLNINDWNKATHISNVQADGGQVIIPSSFTWIADNNHDNAVAYDYWGQDSPQEYNEKMRHQRLILNNYITSGLGGYQADTNGWSRTTAPTVAQSDHSNYLRASFFPHGYPNDPTAKKVANQPISIGGENLYPYVPSLSNALRILNNKVWPCADVGSYAAGLDCVGFTQRSASYLDSPYTWVQGTWFLGRYFWNDTRGTTGFPTPDNGLSWQVAKTNVLDDTGNIKNLDKIIPGDMLYYGKPSHIAMVLSVQYAQDKVSTPEQIFLIESTFDTVNGVSFGKVINNRTLQFYIDRGNICTVVRLKTN
jgi:hypothetical protein